MTTALPGGRHAPRRSAQLAARLAGRRRLSRELDAVALVDEDGRLVWDLPLLQLLINPGDTVLGDLVGEAEPVTVASTPRRRGGRAPDRRPAACRWWWSTTATGRWAGSWPTT